MSIVPEIEVAICTIRMSNMGKKLLMNKWRCPACLRNCVEIVRRSNNFRWNFEVVLHHDHSVNPRFKSVIICGDCNKIDGIIKLQNLELNSQFWSFTPEEIMSVISVTPHENHKINFEKAIKLAHILQASGKECELGEI